VITIVPTLDEAMALVEARPCALVTADAGLTLAVPEVIAKLTVTPLTGLP
jgi:hypothetical protein